jgi:hypothetical protein
MIQRCSAFVNGVADAFPRESGRGEDVCWAGQGCGRGHGGDTEGLEFRLGEAGPDEVEVVGQEEEGSVDAPLGG